MKRSVASIVGIRNRCIAYTDVTADEDRLAREVDAHRRMRNTRTDDEHIEAIYKYDTGHQY